MESSGPVVPIERFHDHEEVAHLRLADDMRADVAQSPFLLRLCEVIVRVDELGEGAEGQRVFSVVVNLREHVRQQSRRNVVDNHLFVDPALELERRGQSVGFHLPRVARDERARHVVVQSRVRHSVIIQAEVFVTGLGVTRSRDPQLLPALAVLGQRQALDTA